MSVNCNPLEPVQEVISAVADSVKRAGEYPDILQERVRDTIADYTGLTPQNVYAGAGASELIMAVVRAVGPKKALLFEPCFSGYDHALEDSSCEIERYMLREENDFAVTVDDISAISYDTGLVVVSDPSTPSGINTGDELIKKILERAMDFGAAVILDESFYHMSDAYAEKKHDRSEALLKEYDNLFIVRSMTKILAIPGIRAGYVLSSPSNISRLIRHLPEWNLPVMSEEAIIAGIKCMTGTDLIDKTLRVIKEEREYLYGVLEAARFSHVKSSAPYILFRGCEGLYGKMLTRGILIRDCSDLNGLSEGWYRIAVKSHDENKKFAAALKEVINED